MKKLSILVILSCIIMLFSGCVDNKAIDELEILLNDCVNKPAGKISFISTIDRDNKKTEYSINLTYSYNKDGDFLYSLTQYDKENKPIYYEFNNGEVYEEWLLGKGVTEYKKGDKNFILYNKKQPHKYMRILTSIANKKLIKSCKIENTDTKSVYTVEYKEKNLNKELYKDEDYKIKSKITTITSLKDKGINGFSEEIQLIDNDNNPYGVCSLNVSIQDSSASEILKPSID